MVTRGAWMCETGDQSDPARRRRQAYRTAGVLAALVGAIFAAWQVRQFLAARLRPPVGRPAAVTTNPAGTAQRGQPSLAEAMDSPLTLAGLTPLAGDPGQIPPPPGARRAAAYERRLSGELQQQGRYQFAGPDEQVVQHYRTVLAGRGLKLLRDSADASGRRDLVFARGPITVTVGLPKRTKQAKIRIIVVSVLRLTADAGAAK